MGAIGGLFSLDGGPPDLERLGTLSRTQEQIGPDGEHILRDGPIALLLRPFLTHTHSSGQDQIYRSAAGEVLVWNGRLDNRVDLRRSLDLCSDENLSAAAIVSLCLIRWGLGALSRLLGDFSLAFWQPVPRRLTLATDVFALRPIFYFADDSRLVWASRCRAVAEAAGLPLELNEPYLATFLIRSLPSVLSPIKGVRRLPQACSLQVEGGRIRVEKYWSPDPGKELIYSRAEKYEEHYLDLLTQAVGCRLETDGPVFAELSGGVDSSSIVCLGDRLLCEGKTSAPQLHTISYVYKESPTSDESSYIESVESSLGRKGLHVDNEDAPLLSLPPDDPSFQPDFPSGQMIYLARHQRVEDLMSERGSRVLLRGFGGDQITWGDVGLIPFEVADHLVALRWGRAVRSCHQWSLASKIPFHLTFWRGGLWPLLPRSLRKRTSSFSLPVESWLHPDFVRRLDLRDSILGSPVDMHFPRPSQAEQFVAICEIAQQVGWELTLGKGCVECRFPFFDRRLVEFALATPMHKMVAPGEPRRLVRRALAGLLPPRIQARRGKAGPDEAVYRTFSRQASQLAELVRDPLVAQYGIVDRAAFQRAIELVRYGKKVDTPQLLRILALEFWLRSLARRHDSERINPKRSA